MYDGYFNIYDDNPDADNPPADAGNPEPPYDSTDDSVSDDTGSGDPAQTPADSASGSDGTDEPGTENDTGTPADQDGETPGTEEIQTPEDGAQNMEGEETAEGEEGEETETTPAVDPEILLDIKDTLHSHADSVHDFTSGLTVSGNVIQVSLDAGSTDLLAESVDQQDKILEGIDAMSGLILLVFFVLAFDLLHRFAKRIIKNFMGGEKNATNS